MESQTVSGRLRIPLPLLPFLDKFCEMIIILIADENIVADSWILYSTNGFG
jgi:hypothetical protein